MKIAVIIPTYNEKDNIERLVYELLTLDLKVDVYVVDDNSKDGTAKIVDEIGKKDRRVKLLLRKNKRGRGSAVIDGMKLALEDKGVNYFVEMDADFSHDPKELIKLVGKVEESDVVIGSRYLKDSKIVGWPAKRYVFSRVANFYAKIILGIPISDYTNGYRCYRREVIKAVDYSKIQSKGYIVLSEMAYQIYKKGFKFKDVGIVFVNRQRGASNLKMREIAGAFSSVWRIKFS